MTNGGGCDTIDRLMGYSQAVRHQTLTLAFSLVRIQLSQPTQKSSFVYRDKRGFSFLGTRYSQNKKREPLSILMLTNPRKIFSRLAQYKIIRGSLMRNCVKFKPCLTPGDGDVSLTSSAGSFHRYSYSTAGRRFRSVPRCSRNSWSTPSRGGYCG